MARVALAASLAALALTIPASSVATLPESPSRTLYVGGSGTLNIAALRVDRTGQLSTVDGSPYPTGMGFSYVITPDGRRMYVGSLATMAISAYDIKTDGRLVPLKGSNRYVGQQVVGMALTRDGERLFVTTGPAGTSVISFDVTPAGPLVPTGATTYRIPGSTFWSLPAISHDQRFLYVVDWQGNRITSHQIGPDSMLVPVGTPLTAGGSPAYPTITPNGRFLYVSNEGGGSVSGYAIGKDGTLSELPGSPYSAGDGPHGTAITKDGRRMYVPASNGGTIAGFRIGADGSLSPLPGSPYNGPGSAALLGRAVLSPDDRHLFQVEAIALSSTSKVYAYSVESDGSLVREPHPGIGTGVVFSDGPSAHFTPNQGPNAALKVSSVNGRTWTYSAGGSYDTDGDVVRYRWAFGDGATALTTTPSVDHTYTEAGSWSVTVTVIDDEGCSNRQVYTGIVVTCNGGSQARSTVHAVVG